MENFLKGFGLFCITVLLVISGGYVVLALYNWFLLTTFSLPSLSVANAIGISLIIGYFKNPNVKREKNYTYGETLINIFASQVACVAIGFIVHMFM